MRTWLRDEGWARWRLPPPLQLALATFGILALELTIIRWASTQIRVLAYFNNLLLIGAFLGMGLGVTLGRRWPGLLHWTLPVLLVLVVPVGFSETLGLVHLRFPDVSVHLWGGEERQAAQEFVLHLAIVFALFWLTAAVFICAGSAVGCLFSRTAPLRAYSFDLAGSLAGTIVFTAATALHTSPALWMAVAVLPFVLLSRRWWSVASAAAVIAVGWVSGQGAQYSPYNRIDVQRVVHGRNGRVGYQVHVNRDFHQFLDDLSDAALADPSLSDDERPLLGLIRQVYDLPFVLDGTRQRAMIVGAGTGNDVQAALRAGYQSVYSVYIDGQIMDIGRALHPEQPYSDPRVHRIVNDARAFFEQYDGPPFDVVCYGFLYSHAMLSAMASLRLENYVYTEEGFRAAWRLVAPGGHLTVHFSVTAGDWLADRMYWTLARATGRVPVMLKLNDRILEGRTFVVSRDGAHLDWVTRVSAPRIEPRMRLAQVATTSDDWPFLYIRPGVFPWGYVLLLGAVLLSAAIAIRGAFGRAMFRGSFDAPLFCMGAAFLLIETRGVTNLSLLFGSTWVVNAAVFTGILVTVLAANILVAGYQPARVQPWFIPLFGALFALWAVNVGVLNAYPLLVRGLCGALLTGLPVGFAGVILSTRLLRSGDPTAALGSNLLGALLGGCLEYLSMYVGIRALVWIAAIFYLVACVLLQREGVRLANPPNPSSEAPPR